MDFAFTRHTSIDLCLPLNITCWSIIHKVRFHKYMITASFLKYLKFSSRSDNLLLYSFSFPLRYYPLSVGLTIFFLRVVPQYSSYFFIDVLIKNFSIYLFTVLISCASIPTLVAHWLRVSTLYGTIHCINLFALTQICFQFLFFKHTTLLSALTHRY